MIKMVFMVSETKKKITKIYVTSQDKVKSNDVCYLVMSNKCFPTSIRKLTEFNWLVSLEYEDEKDLINICETKIIRSKDVSVKRVFKSMTSPKVSKDDPHRGFLMRIAMGISEIITKKVDIKITNNRADNWQKELIKIWAGELENPKVFKENDIKPLVDISQSGELEFCIVRGKNYVITFFNESIDDYTKQELYPNCSESTCRMRVDHLDDQEVDLLTKKVKLLMAKTHNDDLSPNVNVQNIDDNFWEYCDDTSIFIESIWGINSLVVDGDFPYNNHTALEDFAVDNHLEIEFKDR